MHLCSTYQNYLSNGILTYHMGCDQKDTDRSKQKAKSFENFFKFFAPLYEIQIEKGYSFETQGIRASFKFCCSTS